jgi:hypothetical protein
MWHVISFPIDARPPWAMTATDVRQPDLAIGLRSTWAQAVYQKLVDGDKESDVPLTCGTIESDVDSKICTPKAGIMVSGTGMDPAWMPFA